MNALLVIFLVFFCGLNAENSERWAFIVSSSKYWYNYRHESNALQVYRLLRDVGKIPDSRIQLFLTDTFACDPRNAKKGSIFAHSDHQYNLSPHSTRINSFGCQSSVNSLLESLLGINRENYGLRSSANVLFYVTGHGVDGFLKFSDNEELSSVQIESTLQKMRILGKFNKLLFISDTCEASTLSDHIKTPNVVSIASSGRGRKSYAYQSDKSLGVSLTDRFTTLMVRSIQRSIKSSHDSTISGLINEISQQDIRSNMQTKATTKIDWGVQDFFKAHYEVQLMNNLVLYEEGSIVDQIYSPIWGNQKANDEEIVIPLTSTQYLPSIVSSLLLYSIIIITVFLPHNPSDNTRNVAIAAN